MCHNAQRVQWNIVMHSGPEAGTVLEIARIIPHQRALNSGARLITGIGPCIYHVTSALHCSSSI
jgi:hypothetical protein